MIRRATITFLSTILLALPAAAQTPAIHFDGRPEFKEGKALGYFIWRDGETWKLRWTTFGAEHKFTGRVVAEGGDIASFKRIDVDEERKVIRPGMAPHTVRGPAGRVRAVRPGVPTRKCHAGSLTTDRRPRARRSSCSATPPGSVPAREHLRERPRSPRVPVAPG